MKMKPCPFCGEKYQEALEVVDVCIDEVLRSYKCPRCGTRTPSLGRNGLHCHWNQRPATKPKVSEETMEVLGRLLFDTKRLATPSTINVSGRKAKALEEAIKVLSQEGDQNVKG
jgi:tRNA(Ile2) C34 agmatinyltransferase TiaS